MHLLTRILLTLLLISSVAFAQNAQLTGIVKDPTEAAIAKATVTLSNLSTGSVATCKTNSSGFYTFASVEAGRYTVRVEAKGFSETSVENVRLETAGDQRLDIEVKIAQGNQTVTVQAASVNMNTEDASVGTVVDHVLISELPMNGRSLDTLFLLTPGTVASGTQNAGGQYSVNGQRSSSNYLTVDGASGNIYVSSNVVSGGPVGTGQTGIAGSTYATSASGGTNGLLPVDAIEEYRMQTSTYSAEYGRSPGGQIQIRTRGGTNNFHGSLFEYFRNQVMDATDWFVKYNNLKQAPLRMNDYGGTFSGPILRNRLFYFFAHETLFLDQPNNTSVGVPSALARQQASQSFAPFLASYPNGNGGIDFTAKYPQYTDVYNVEYATQVVDHSTSARFDTSLPHDYKLFFRFNIAPSSSTTTTWQSTTGATNLDTYTAGVTKYITSSLLDELTWNYSQNNARFTYASRAIGGADPSGFGQYCRTVPIGSQAPLCLVVGLNGWGSITQGSAVSASAQQTNVADVLRWSIRRHSLSFGVDFRRVPTTAAAFAKGTVYIGFFSGPSALSGNVIDQATVTASKAKSITLPVDNLSLFVQDDWHIMSRLTVNYGLRWEYNPPISDGNGGPLALTGNVNDLASLSPAPLYTPLYKPTYANFAPRLGIAYQLRSMPRFATVVRTGVGLFYDTGQAATTASSINNNYPYALTATQKNVAYSQLDFQALAQSAAVPQLPQPSLYVVDPNLKLPYTGQWNFALEQQLFGNSTVSATYLGADGEKLASTIQSYGLASALVTPTGYIQLLTNHGRSNYQAFQLQTTIRTASGINGIVAYTYSHNIDNGSSDFAGPKANVTDYRASADDDIRHVFAMGLNFKPKGLVRTKLLGGVTHGWVLNTFTRLQTASPLSVMAVNEDATADQLNSIEGFADRVSGVPIYLRGAIGTNGKSIPGGVQLNPAAFTNPPEASNNSFLRDGNSGRNAYRLFGLHEFDLSVGRTFAFTERVGFEFKAEAFNLFNNATFADVSNSVGNANFGQAQNTYAGFTGGSGGLNSAFQVGGARNLQLTGRLSF